MKLKDIYNLFDCGIEICDNDNHDYKFEESKNMEVVSIQLCYDKMLVIVDKFSTFD